jgi:ubiquinone/menaquinone biosynthesis C-methylase UbiE
MSVIDQKHAAKELFQQQHIPISSRREDGNWTSVQHALVKRLTNRLFFAPITNPVTRPLHILDVGCKTGYWAAEIAQSLSFSRIVGIDTKEHMQRSQLPSQYLCVQADLLSGLPYASASFDYVHQSFRSHQTPASAWSRMLRELYRVTRPGSWIELLETGAAYIRSGPITEQVLFWWKELASLDSVDIEYTHHLERALTQAGCTRVQQQMITVPLGQWGGTLGEAASRNAIAKIVAGRPRLLSTLGLNPEHLDQIVSALPLEWEEYKTTTQVYAVFGQRPSVAEGDEKSTLLQIKRTTPVTTQAIAEQAHLSVADVFTVETGGYCSRQTVQQVVAAFNQLSGMLITIDDIRVSNPSL